MGNIFAGVTTPAADTLHDGRIFEGEAHQGGWIFRGVSSMAADSANLAIVRLAAGNWVLQRTSAGAETYHVRISLDGSLFRLPETPTLNTLGGNPTQFPIGKGIEVTDIEVIYGVGVVNLTSMALTLSQVIYANGSAVTVTSVPLTSTTLTLTAASSPYAIDVPVTTPSFNATDLSTLVAELTVVLANTGVFTLYGLGFHCNFDFI